MFRRILVPLDGSARAEQALPVAARLARAAQGTVILVEVANLEYGMYVAAAPVPQGVIDRDLDDAQAYLESITRRDDFSGMATETDVLSGPVADTILGAIESHHADVVVLCSHGRTGFTRWALGSVAQKIARYAPVPVLVLRTIDHTPGVRAGTPEHRFSALVSLDGSSFAETAIQPAVALVTGLAGSEPGVIHLIQVLDVPLARDEPGPYAPREEVDAAHRDALAYLDRVAARVRRDIEPERQLTVMTCVAYNVDAAAAIVDVAEGRGDAQHQAMLPAACDVIAMTTHGRHGLAHWALGSVTERVLDGTRLPLLVVRPAEVAEQQRAAEEAMTEPSSLPRTAPLYPNRQRHE